MATTTFNTNAVSIPSGGWVLVGIIQLGGNRAGMNINLANTGANALTHLKLTKSGVAGGTHNDWIGASDSDWSSLPAGEFLSVTPAAINALASGATGQIHIGNCKGIQEVGIYAQAGTTTTLQASGTASS